MRIAPSVERTKTLEEKLDEIEQFCGQCGYGVKTSIEHIKDNLGNLSDKFTSLIDRLYIAIVGLKRKKAKAIFVDVIEILGYILALVGVFVPLVGIASKCVFLVVCFLKIAFQLIDIKESLRPSNDDVIVHELAGLAEKLERTENFINAVDVQEHVDEATLQGLISNVDIHIAVDQLGNLKSRINSFLTRGQDLRTCLHFLTLFVRISTLRHSLLFRFATCLRLKNFSPGTVTALKTYIETERLTNQKFLFSLFSLPSLENAAVLTVFDPSEGNVDELVTYIKELRIPLLDLNNELHDKTFLIKPLYNPSIYLGRPFPSLSSIRSMTNSTSVSNVRIRFKFTAVKGEFNLFYIQSPDLGEYMYMKENTFCKYQKMSCAPAHAMWRLIRVRATKEMNEDQSSFLFCNKKWPEKIIFMERSFYECARGKNDTTAIGQECLFTLIPPCCPPINIPIPCPGNLPVPEDCVEKETPNQRKRNFTDEKRSMPALATIHVFLEKHDIKIGNEIDQIENYLSEDENDHLHHSVKRIAESLTYLDENNLNESTMQGILEIISVNFRHFQENFLYNSIYRILLRVCCLILSRVWQVCDIESFVCSPIETGYFDELTVARDVRNLIRFASYLREIEQAENILERNITEMANKGSFCEELPCLANLKKHAKTQSCIMLTCVKVSILQLSVLWQMYAVAKLPGHSEKTANHLLRVILSQKDDDIKFYDCSMFPKAIHEMSMVKAYMICLGCDVQRSERRDVTKLTTKQKLERMHLIVVPLLEEMLKKRFDWLISKLNKKQK